MKLAQVINVCPKCNKTQECIKVDERPSEMPYAIQLKLRCQACGKAFWISAFRG